MIDIMPRQMQETGNASGLRVALRLVQHVRIVVVAEEQRAQRAQSLFGALLCAFEQRRPEHAVVAAPAEKTKIFALKTRRGIGRHQRTFDQQGSRTAHRIDERTAGCEHLRPAGAEQHCGSEIFLQRRFALPAPPAAPMQRSTGEIERKRRPIPIQPEIDAYRRSFDIDARARAGARAELIDDRILDPLRDELCVAHRARGAHRVDRERAIDGEMLGSNRSTARPR